jgi:serine/threonine-protein kinase
MTLPVEEGTLLAGKYRIEKVLGEGGMGVVVAARHVDLDQRVAIKFLLPHALADETVVARFAREARAAAKIQSPHVAKVMDVGRLDDGSPYMVMEYLEGEDLESRLQRDKTIPVSEAVGIMLQACEAMAEAHAAGIIHRDLKPANLFLARTPGRKSVVKVLDFGISKIANDSGKPVTQTASLLGTPYYMSPEQLRSVKTLDARSDIWAMGVILYELLGGSVPFLADTMPGVVAMILQNDPPPLAELCPTCPKDLVAVIAKCMKSDPSQRFSDVGELARALAPFGDAAAQGSVDATTRALGAAASMSPESMRKFTSAPTIDTGRVSLPEERKPGTLDAASVTREVRGSSRKLDLVAEPSEILPADAPKRSPFLVVGGLGVLLAVGGFAAYFATRPPSGPVGTSVATATTEPSATATTTAASASTSAPVANPSVHVPEPSATTTAIATNVVPLVTTHGVTPKPSTSAAASVTAAASATAVVAPSATVVATPTTTTTTTATAKPSGNVVSNMGLK